TMDPKSGTDLGIMGIDGDRTVRPLIHSTANESNAEISPDGRWIAYQSNDSIRDEIYVRPFPAVDGGVWQISTDGGSRPAWSRNGRELFYVAAPVPGSSPRTRIVSVPIQAGATFVAGKPAVAAETNFHALVNNAAVTGAGRYYDVSPDGRRFL